MTPVSNDSDVQVASGDEIMTAVQQTLTNAGVSLAELRHQAAIGHFSSERARRAWFVVAPVARRG